jgi:hypothetical protein
MENIKHWPEDPRQDNYEKATARKNRRGGIHNNALYAASMGRAATSQVNPHNNRGLANTGTNISYEGATAPGSGGSVGSGYSSGMSAAESSISTNSDYDQARIGKGHKIKNEDTSAPFKEHDEEKDII